ncbi:aminopeptidase Ey-like [Hippoglossus hippoglossus]|uniref:aminopeptidase Ey-like n=1 Tax=Hippoglossus hippoglossus TaxID=8267 RepID=UPI00148E4578|nr:aminopeptidase Ey-like [Hippoglossus hippoglossus]
MVKNCKSKLIAGACVVLTISVIAGIVTMVVFYTTQISTMNPTPRPTFLPTTTQLPPDRRLPRNLVPESYEVVLQPHFYTRIIEVVNVTSPNQSTLFTGNSTVYFKCVQKTSSIYLHSRELEVSDSVVKNRDNLNEEIRSSVVDPGNLDFMEIQLNVALEAGGNYSLFLNFKGESMGTMDGLFLSTYLEGVPEYEGDMNPVRFLAATNLEPTFARTVFPCFDEPDMKAVFHVSIIHRRGTEALGNALTSGSSIIDDEWQYTRFYPTPRMSTYLLAFTVSEFESIPSTHERVDIQTFARPEAIAAGHTQYAANITGKILRFYEEKFGINYSLKKLYQIALPDLNPMAMENWGLVTYQQGYLLFEEGVSSLLHKELIATLIAHELAHQWFGNLVTMKWWNEVWLNEGFATYMAYFAVDAVEPSFKTKDSVVVLDLHMAFEEDALAASHPLTAPQKDIQTTSEILEMFDAITYSKGAMVLRMLADIVGQNVFNRGINMYLSDFRYNNTDQKNLWDYIQKAVDEDGGHTEVATVMHKWTNQIGYPVVTINTTSGQLDQKHFLFNDSSESSLWWHVPIKVMSSSSEPSLEWLDTIEVSKDKFIAKNGEWILANVNTTGYYRVNYDLENWDALSSQMENDQERIPLINRGQLIDDAFNLARAKLVDVTLALNLTRFLRNETEFIPWKSAMTNLGYFVLMFDRSEVYGPMQTYLREQVTGLYNFYKNYTDHSRVPKDHSSQHSQINAVRVACSNGLPECVTMATRMFAIWMKNDTNIIHPNLRSTVYCQAVASGGKAQWDFAWDKLQSSNDTSERDQLRAALSCSRETWLLNRYLQYTLDPEKIRFMDVSTVINLIALNPAGQALAWNFIRANWEFLSYRGGGALIDAVARRFSTEFELEELERFVTDNDLGYMREEQAIEQTRVNIQWVKEHKEKILQWFETETGS